MEEGPAADVDLLMVMQLFLLYTLHSHSGIIKANLGALSSRSETQIWFIACLWDTKLELKVEKLLNHPQSHPGRPTKKQWNTDRDGPAAEVEIDDESTFIFSLNVSNPATDHQTQPVRDIKK